MIVWSLKNNRDNDKVRIIIWTNMIRWQRSCEGSTTSPMGNVETKTLILRNGL